MFLEDFGRLYRKRCRHSSYSDKCFKSSPRFENVGKYTEVDLVNFFGGGEGVEVGVPNLAVSQSPSFSSLSYRLAGYLPTTLQSHCVRQAQQALSSLFPFLVRAPLLIVGSLSIS